MSRESTTRWYRGDRAMTEVPEKRLLDLVRIEGAAERFVAEVIVNAGRVDWPVDRDGDSRDSAIDALAIALKDAVRRAGASR